MKRVHALSISTTLLLAMGVVLPLLPSRSFGLQLRAKRVAVRAPQPEDSLPEAEPKAATSEYARQRDEMRALAAQGQVRPVVPTPVFEVVPHPESLGVNRNRQVIVAGLISRQAQEANFAPEARLRHFTWLKGGANPPILGWKGTIVAMAETMDGVRVHIKVQPVFPGSFRTNVMTDEVYLIANGVVHPVAIENSDPSGPRVIVWP